MLLDLNDAWGWIQKLIRRMDRVESGAMLENSSITNGRMRFIGGLLRLDSGARLEGVGTFQWSGAGSIAGNWEVLQGGVIKVGGVLISPVGGGRIMVGEGPVGIILDGGTGTLTMGNIRLEGGKIYVGVGASQIVIDGATGKMTAGNVVVESNKVTIGGADGNTVLTNSQVQFANGGIVATDSSGGISMRVGNTRARVADGVVQMTIGTRSIVINSTGISAGLPTAPLANWPGRQVGDVVSNTSGDLFRIV